MRQKGLSSARLPMTELAGRSSRSATEHSAEGADALVAQIEGDTGHGFAGTQSAHCFEDAGLLAPAAEGHTRLALEAAGEGAGARMRHGRPILQGPYIARIAQQRLADRPQARVARHRKLQGQEL